MGQKSYPVYGTTSPFVYFQTPGALSFRKPPRMVPYFQFDLESGLEFAGTNFTGIFLG